MVGQDDRDATSIGFPGEIELPRSDSLKGIRLGVPEELSGDGRRHRGRRARRVQRDAAARRVARRDRRDLPPAARPARAERLLRARARRGVLEPRPLRRRALRHARRERRPRRDVHEDPQPGLRARGQAAHHARHVLAVQRLLRRLLRPRAARAHEDRRRLPHRVRSVRLRRHADLAVGRVRARREDRRPAVDVPQRLLHRADVAGRDPRDLDPQRPERRPADGLSALRPGVQREPRARRGLRARAGDRLREPGPRAQEPRA